MNSQKIRLKCLLRRRKCCQVILQFPLKVTEDVEVLLSHYHCDPSNQTPDPILAASANGKRFWPGSTTPPQSSSMGGKRHSSGSALPPLESASAVGEYKAWRREWQVWCLFVCGLRQFSLCFSGHNRHNQFTNTKLTKPITKIWNFIEYYLSKM